MAKADISEELDEFAFRLYAERVAKAPAQANGEALTCWAYRKAHEFLSVREKVKAGDKSPMAVSRLAEASAPNLKKTHPLNLVSQRFADENGGEARVLARIKDILDWLRDHPRSDENPVAYEQLDWDVPATNTARAILPHYVGSN